MSHNAVREDREVRQESDGLDLTIREHTVRDGDRSLVFEGCEIGFATTWGSRPGRPRPFDDLRWTEITIYRTEAGAYVVSTVGISDVYHLTDDAGGCSYGELTTAAELHDDRWPCPVCRPPDLDDLADDDVVTAEVDRHSATKADSAATLVAACYSTDSHGVPFLASVMRRALTQATKTDPAVAQAYFSERVA